MKSRIILKYLIGALFLFLFFTNPQLIYAQNTTGTGVKATSGSGQNREVVYWLNWGRSAGQNFQAGDKSVFTTTTGITYTVTISEIKTYNRTSTNPPINYNNTPESSSQLIAINYDNWAGNGFQYFYDIPDTGNDKVISFQVHHRRATFKITIEAEDAYGNPVADKNIVIAGTESVANRWEKYGLKVDNSTKVFVIEGYKNITTGQWHEDADTANFACLIENKDEGGGKKQ